MSRNKIPFEAKSKSKSFLKHLSIISFKPEALIKFAKSKKSNLEKNRGYRIIKKLIRPKNKNN